MTRKITFIIIAIVLFIGLSIGGFFCWKNWKQSKIKDEAQITTKTSEETASQAIDNATQGILPSIGTDVLENKPDINPADKANPFTNIKLNPFE